MSFNLFESAKKNVLVVAHRGACGGNIPCNTLASYGIAVKQGADMIEVDVEMSADGKLFVFHPGMEPWHLFHRDRISRMSSADIAQLRYVNTDCVKTQFGINTFDEILDAFKNKCYINVDKFWGHPKEIAAAIRRHNMEDQILVKSSLSDRVLSVLEEVAPDIPFMAIVRNNHDAHESLMKRSIHYIGAEVLFESETAEVASPTFVERMHRDGKLVWANSIIYDCREQLAAGHSDDTALTESEEKGWGWLADRGYDFIQTDWPLMLINYLKSANKYYR